ncbi:MAG: hypothetical protein HOP29_15950 [Phycisphaerales bacterium]|nr:hypothetical protein [Phycisphaerales bacterium]
MADSGSSGRYLVGRTALAAAFAIAGAAALPVHACDKSKNDAKKCCAGVTAAAAASVPPVVTLATAPRISAGTGRGASPANTAPRAGARGTSTERTTAPRAISPPRRAAGASAAPIADAVSPRSVIATDGDAPVAPFYAETVGDEGAGGGRGEAPAAVWAQLAGDKETEAELTARLAALEAQLAALQGQLDMLSSQLADAHARHGGTPPPGGGHAGPNVHAPMPGHAGVGQLMPMMPAMPPMPSMPSQPGVPMFAPMPPMPAWNGDDEGSAAYQEALEEYREAAEGWADEYRERYDGWREQQGELHERMREQYREWADRWRGEQQEFAERFRGEAEEWRERAHESANEWRERLAQLHGEGREVREDARRRVRDAAESTQQKARAELDAVRERVARTRERVQGDSRDDGRVVYPVVGKCADRLFELLAPDYVKPVVSREGENIAVAASRDEQQAIEAGLQLLGWIDRDEAFERMRQGESESRVYRVGAERAEQLFEMLAPDEVKIVVARAGGDAVSVSGTPREHEVLSGFLAVVGWDADSDAPGNRIEQMDREKAVKEKAVKQEKSLKEKRSKEGKARGGVVFAPRADAAPDAAAPSGRGTSDSTAERMGQAYEMNDDAQAGKLYELLAPAEVKVIVSRSGDDVAIQGTEADHAVLESALQLLGWIERDDVFERMRQGEAESRVYPLGDEHTDTVYEMLSPDDVKVVVARSGDDAVSINATQKEHEVLTGFFSLLNWSVVP